MCLGSGGGATCSTKPRLQASSRPAAMQELVLVQGQEQAVPRRAWAAAAAAQALQERRDRGR